MKTNQTLEVKITIRSAKGQRACKREVPDPLPPAIPRIAKLMGLAIRFQDMVDRGEVRDYADIARLGLVSRARLTQIMNLLLLAPDIQERLLLGVSEKTPLRETQIRPIMRFVHWDDQRQTFNL